MKKYFIQTLVFCLISVLSTHAQEKSKVHVKIIKEEDGKTIVIDTTFDELNHEYVYFYGDKHFSEHKIDSILGEFKMCDQKGVKVISLSEDIHTCDSLENIFVTVNTDIDDEDAKMKHIYITSDGEKSTIEQKSNVFWLGTDSIKVTKHITMDDEDGVFTIKSDDEEHIKIVEKGSGDMMIWTVDSIDSKSKATQSKIVVFSTGENSLDIIESDDEDVVVVKEIIVSESGDAEKNISVHLNNIDKGNKIIEVIYDEDDGDKDEKMSKLEDALRGVDGEVKIERYKTDDGKIVLKAEIIGESEKNIEKKTEKLKIIKGKESGVFDIEFELDKIEPTLLIVENMDGKTVYSKKLKKFNGEYSGKIDLSKEPEGKYIMQIIQGDEMLIKKELQR